MKTKTLAPIGIIIVLAAIAGWAFVRYQPRQEVAFEVAAEEPAATVQSFYDWYLSYPGNPLADEAYAQREELAPEFIEEIGTILAAMDGRGGFDPVLCAQDKPAEIQVKGAEAGDGGVTVYIESVFGRARQSVPVTVVQAGDGWQITGVQCGAGQPVAEGTGEPMEVVVYFSNALRAGDGMADCGLVFGTERTVEKTEAEMAAALNELFKGPTVAEQAEGYNSPFSAATNHALISVEVRGRTAYVNLTDIRETIPNASSSCGSAQLLAQMDETVKHNRTVDRVIYAIEGNPQEFYDWIQIGCGPANDNCNAEPFK